MLTHCHLQCLVRKYIYHPISIFSFSTQESRSRSRETQNFTGLHLVHSTFNLCSTNNVDSQVCNIFILRDEKCIEFRNRNNLSQILYIHSVAPHVPRVLSTSGSSMLLYDDGSKRPYHIHWLDCNESKPKLLKKKSFTTSLLYLNDMIRVQNGAEELLITSDYDKGIHCYSTTTKP